MENTTANQTHILVECPALIASVRVGVLHALAPLEERNLCRVRFSETRSMTKENLVWCDILVCVRGSEDMTLRLVREAKHLGRLVLYFLDDDLLHLPEQSLAYEYFYYGDHQRALREILAISDGLWGANDRIREEYLPLCPARRWIVTKMPIWLAPEAEAPAEAEPAEVVHILYAGSVDHQNIIREILSPAVELVTAQCGDRVTFTFVGPDPHLRHHPQVRHQPFFEDYGQYRDFVAAGGFQIGLAPTKLDPFYQCKYYNKFVEYTSIGAVGVYTDCSLYQQIVMQGENGVLCENTPQAWAEAIVRLVEQPDLRERCRRHATQLLRTAFRPEQVAQSLLEQVPELANYQAPACTPRQVHLYSPLVCFYAGRIRFLFHRYHLLAIPVIAWKALKKMVKSLLRR